MNSEKNRFQFIFHHSVILMLFFLITQSSDIRAQSGFNCGDTIHYGGDIYNTVQIGNQCWLVENLNIGTMIDGDSTQTDNDTIEKFCYNNLESNCDQYGGLYQWDEMMRYATTNCLQGICPDGWHIPTDTEWKILEGTVDTQYPVGDPEWNTTSFNGFDAGMHLKSATGWWAYYSNCNGADTYGFTVLPGGYRYFGGGFEQIEKYGIMWSSTEYYNTGQVWMRRFGCGDYGNQTYRMNHFKTEGFSVRCINSEFSVAAHDTIQNVTIESGEEACFNATSSITTAGSGTYFTVESGGYVKLVTMEKVSFLPGTTIATGGNLSISFPLICPYCYLENMIPQGSGSYLNPVFIEQDPIIPEVSEKKSYKIYPNPTSGNFVVELYEITPDQQIRIEVYGMQCEKVLQDKLTGVQRHEFSLANKPAGIYLIRIISGYIAETTKLIKQ